MYNYINYNLRFFVPHMENFIHIVIIRRPHNIPVWWTQMVNLESTEYHSSSLYIKYKNCILLFMYNYDTTWQPTCLLVPTWTFIKVYDSEDPRFLTLVAKNGEYL